MAGGTGAAVTQAAGQNGQDHQPSSGGGVHSFDLESITAGDDCVALQIDGDIDAYAAPQLRVRVTRPGR